MGVSALWKPEYLLRPSQIAHRLYWSAFPARGDRITTRLPWGWPIEVDPVEEIGKALLHLGVYDLVVSETLWRLTDPGETALDVGANLGYMTGLLARRVGGSGHVLSFEALPQNARELQRNVATWAGIVGPDVVRIFEVALSDSVGTVVFQSPDDPTRNRGTGRVVGEGEGGSSALSLPCSTLDECCEGVGNVGVAKLDVEGHEEAVLKGARQILAARRVRDWVFEQHDDYPSPVTNFLESHGYHVFQIDKRFLGPRLVEASQTVQKPTWVPRSFLATLDGGRALGRMKPSGWRSLSRSDSS